MTKPLLSGLTPFSDRLGPVVVKELRQGLRADRFVFPFVAAQLLAVVAVGLELYFSRIEGDLGNYLGRGVIVMSVASFFINLVMPLTAMGALQPELGAGRNVELLMTANLSRWQIAIGKWLVTLILSLLLLTSQIPYLLALFQLGGLELSVVLAWGFTSVSVNAALVALAVGASGYENVVGRLFIFGIGLVSFAICFSTVTFSGTAHNLVFGLISSISVTAMFVLLGLQLARARLMVGYHPLDPPPSGLVIALMVFSPIVLGMLTAITIGYGGWLAAFLMCYIAYIIDPGPGRKSQRAYHRP
ncbi:MAG: hypothetical protein IT576_09365 [Verrucomicrobiales bacterium]|nr:hypothetical protein [Verrucomicrobiales bacterium]